MSAVEMDFHATYLDLRTKKHNIYVLHNICVLLIKWTHRYCAISIFLAPVPLSDHANAD